MNGGGDYVKDLEDMKQIFTTFFPYILTSNTILKLGSCCNTLFIFSGHTVNPTSAGRTFMWKMLVLYEILSILGHLNVSIRNLPWYT